MSDYTRIYNKFTGYSTADYACEWCLHWRGKKRGCRLEECCCMEERLEAARRGLKPVPI